MPDKQRAPQEKDKINVCAEKCHRKGIPDRILSQNCTRKETMDPFSVTVSAVALAGSFGTTASVLKTLHSDYRDADKDSHHIQQQKKHLQLNQSLLDGLVPDATSPLHCLKSSLADIEAALPTQPCEGKKRDRLRWAACGGKRKAQDKIGKLKEIESSTSISLLLTANDKLSVCILYVANLQYSTN
jgi:hypothetical protein